MRGEKMNIAILTAGGIGSRTHQDLPKQFLTVENKPIIIYTLEAFQQHPSIDEIYVSCLDGWSAVLEAYAKQFNITKLKRIVTSSQYRCRRDGHRGRSRRAGQRSEE